MTDAEPPIDGLAAARAVESELRSTLAELVVAQRAATVEAERLDARSRLEGAHPDLARAADDQRERATALAAKVAAVRQRIRDQEAAVARLEVERDRVADQGRAG